MIEDVKSLGKLIDKAAEIWPDNEAIIYKEKKISYKILKEGSDRLALFLLQMGVKKGDKVAVLLTNLPDWAFAEYAVVKIGGVVVPINTRYSISELEYILRQSDTTTLIMMEHYKKIDYMSMIRELCPSLHSCKPGMLSCSKLPLLKNIIVSGKQKYPGTFAINELPEDYNSEDFANLAKIQEEVSPDDIAHLPYTSGTTGKPKGVMTSHAQYIRFNLGFIQGIGGFTHKDRLLVAPPFSHNFGNSQGLLTPAFCGSASILIEAFDARACLELIEKEKCTFFAGSPTMYIKILRDDHFPNYDLSSLRAGLIAAAPAPIPVIEEIKRKMGIDILVNGYGMTENSIGTSMTVPGDSTEILSKTVGRPLWPDYEVRVVDINTGDPLTCGNEGELCTRGPLIMKGYYKMPDETAALIDREGWFHTGDLAVIDEDGYIRITGRLSDIYIPGGLNVSPEEVENVLYSHPKVKQVSVLGIPDDVMGEVGAAFVELKDGIEASEKEIMDFCKDQLANYKIPKYIFFTNDFPMTSSGKVMRFMLKERAVKSLNL